MVQEYFNALSKNAPFVIAAVLGLATLYKSLGLGGRWLLLAAFFTGCLIGAGFQIASVGIPITFTEYFYVLISAILMGLMPTGVYEAIKAANRSAARA
jgi:hypothetical protein